MTLRLFIRYVSLVLVLQIGAWPTAAKDTKKNPAAEPKPYVVKNGETDQNTYNGWRRYSDSCLRCHGPDGSGSSYGPDLTNSLKTLNKDQFLEIVMSGRMNISQAAQNVMPPFGMVEDVAQYIDDIYGYLKARSDGVLDRGRPVRFKVQVKK